MTLATKFISDIGQLALSILLENVCLPDTACLMWHMIDLHCIVATGTTAQEIDMNPAPGGQIETWNMDDLRKYVHRKLRTFNPSYSNRSLELYKTDVKMQYLAEYIFSTMTTDLRITCGNDIMAGKMSRAFNSNVYRYIVTSFPSEPVSVFGYDFKAKFAFHAWDTYAFFGTFRYILGTRGSDADFQYTLRRNIMHFVEEGRPADDTWKAYKYNVTALIGRDLKANATYHKEQCDFWINKGFFPYSWIN